MAKRHIIEIKEHKDYFEKFYNRFVNMDKLKTEYEKDEFEFKVQILDNEDIDEQKLFEFYLIVDTYSKQKEQFILDCNIDKNRKDENDLYFHVSTYGYLQQKLEKCVGRLCYSDNSFKRMVGSSLNGVSKLVPVFSIDKATLALLKHPVDDETWQKICNSTNPRVDNFEGMLYRLCWSFLFSNVGKNNKKLTELRIQTFQLPQFREYIKDVPVFSLLIFAMLDYSFREEAVKKYKNEIKRDKDIKRVEFKEEDFIQELQDKQKRKNYDAYIGIQQRYDNKTLMSGRTIKTVHPFVIKELYEAITISEGILQLLDNIIRHAGFNSMGKGIASIHIRSYEENERLLHKKYRKYFEDDKNKEKSMYYLEILIADLSWTNISRKFNDNNEQFFVEFNDELKEKINQDIYHGKIPPDINLEDFFNPGTEMKEFWKSYFSFSNKAVNHYGLQIFDSIISAKNGLFLVESGTQGYCNYEEMYEKLENHSVHGTRYTILCPMNGSSTIDTNIYDSMFGYNYKNIGKKQIKTLGNELNNMGNLEREVYIEEVRKWFKNIEWNNERIICIDASILDRLEDFIKGMLMYIFEYKMKSEYTEDKLLIAFLKCKPYQIINIVRMLSIYYDKQGENIKMRGVQVYLRGFKVEEELFNCSL